MTDSPLQLGEEIAVDVHNVAHGGVFVGRHEGRVVFVPDTIPGERVQVRVTEVKKSFARAELVEVLEASEDRVPHIWAEASFERPAAERAGGAEFGHIRFGAQRGLKQRVLEDSLARIGGITRTVDVKAAPGDTERDGLGWRTRVRLQVNERGQIGPYAARTHTVVPVRSLPLASPRIESEAPFDQRFPGATSIDLIDRRDGSVDAIVTEGDVRQGRSETITEQLGEREFRLDRAGFWQVHREAPKTLWAAVQRAIDTDLADPKAANLDLYGGVGVFAAAIAESLGESTRVTSVEADEIATDHASENLADWLGAGAQTARVDRYIRDLVRTASPSERARLRAATVVLDPPRSGAGGDVIAGLVDLSPKQLIYVACDPVALARDAKLLLAGGYEIASAEAFDLFPHTHHLETVVAFQKR
ncbi:class I SAM-dependent RNA methyltransferase [Humidisolicoccus flavus]|uniref:class I SAM-dependent RNA methyltransferase n=1 Tax=Humidisolicoccus flavus TaxID=3111414 RepID=UPI003253BF33